MTWITRNNGQVLGAFIVFEQTAFVDISREVTNVTNAVDVNNAVIV